MNPYNDCRNGNRVRSRDRLLYLSVRRVLRCICGRETGGGNRVIRNRGRYRYGHRFFEGDHTNHFIMDCQLCSAVTWSNGSAARPSRPFNTKGRCGHRSSESQSRANGFNLFTRRKSGLVRCGSQQRSDRRGRQSRGAQVATNGVVFFRRREGVRTSSSRWMDDRPVRQRSLRRIKGLCARLPRATVNEPFHSPTDNICTCAKVQ